MRLILSLVGLWFADRLRALGRGLASLGRGAADLADERERKALGRFDRRPPR